MRNISVLGLPARQGGRERSAWGQGAWLTCKGRGLCGVAGEAGPGRCAHGGLNVRVHVGPGPGESLRAGRQQN